MTVRRVQPDDVPTVLGLVRELAAYEKSEHEVLMTEEQLRTALFGETPALFGHVALADDGEIAGFALWFLNFSTWRGTHGVYLEDLYVSPKHRGSGLGKELLRTLAAVCVERGYSRLEWRCSTGTPRRSTSTRRPAPSLWTSGPSSASPTTP